MLCRALEEGLNVAHPLTIHPSDDSYIYHVPAIDLAALVAESAGTKLVEVHPGDFETIAATDSGAQDDAEPELPETTLSDLQAEMDFVGVATEAIEGELQTDRI